jgi:uncharacterized protein (TIGR02001 family)
MLRERRTSTQTGLTVIRIQIFIRAVLAAAIGFVPGAPGFAQDVNVEAELGAVSDYRFRGVSLSNRRPAVQAGLTLEHKSGAFAGVWGSTIAQTDGGAQAEIDVLAGYSAEIAGGLTFQAVGTFYAYPSDAGLNYVEGGATLSYEIGDLTPEAGLSYIPAQSATENESGSRRDNVYAFAGAEYAIAGTPVTVKARAGWENGAFDLSDRGGKWDWELGASAELGKVTVGLAYVDSDARYTNLRGRNLAGGQVVATATLTLP